MFTFYVNIYFHVKKLKLVFLQFCPLSNCKQQFRQNPEQHLPNMTHLTLHFHKEFSQLLPKTAPFKCPHCLEERVDQMALMLHFGLDHGELEKQVKNYKQKQYSIKNVSLKVDKEERYVKCIPNMCFFQEWFHIFFSLNFYFQLQNLWHELSSTHDARPSTNSKTSLYTFWS